MNSTRTSTLVEPDLEPERRGEACPPRRALSSEGPLVIARAVWPHCASECIE